MLEHKRLLHQGRLLPRAIPLGDQRSKGVELSDDGTTVEGCAEPAVAPYRFNNDDDSCGVHMLRGLLQRQPTRLSAAAKDIRSAWCDHLDAPN